MKKQIKFRLLTCLWIITLSFSVIFAGCGDKNSSSSDSSDSSGKRKEITVKDSNGNSKKLKSNPKSVVVLNNAVAEIIHVLGEDDKIVGASDALKFPDNLAKKSKVGAAYTPNVEKIMELKPDLVIGYSDNIKKETIDKIEAAGIPYIAVDAFKIASLNNDIKTLGTIFNRSEKADEYVTFINKYLNMVKQKTEKLKPEERALVYWEGGTDYSTVSKGSGGDEMMTLSGTKNMAAKETVPYPHISNEWILEKNPQVIIKIASSKSPFGYRVTDTQGIAQQKNTLIKRSGLSNTDAVKKDKVYIMSNEIATSARSVVGICYVAKWCYPDLFKNLDPDAVHKELMEKFYKLDYTGTWVLK